MVSSRDREHFERIAALKRQHADASIARAAARTPSENVEIAFAWSEFAASIGTRQRKTKVAPIQIWRELQRRRGK